MALDAGVFLCSSFSFLTGVPPLFPVSFLGVDKEDEEVDDNEDDEEEDNEDEEEDEDTDEEDEEEETAEADLEEGVGVTGEWDAFSLLPFD